LVFALRILGLNAAKEKLEIVSGAAPPHFQIFAGGFPRRLRRRNALCPVVSFALLLGFGLIQEYCTQKNEWLFTTPVGLVLAENPDLD